MADRSNQIRSEELRAVGDGDTWEGTGWAEMGTSMGMSMGKGRDTIERPRRHYLKKGWYLHGEDGQARQTE
jgi:hypothetical protein